MVLFRKISILLAISFSLISSLCVGASKITHVASLDFDGVIEAGANKVLTAELTKLGVHHVLLGSNRQSRFTERVNLVHKKPSCHPIFMSFLNNLNTSLEHSGRNAAKFYPVVMEDIYTRGLNFLNKKVLRESGAFHQFSEIEKNHTYSNIPTLVTKEDILFVQMQLMSHHNWNHSGRIHFHFYDDRKDILEAVQVFYTKNRHFIPEDVTLFLHHVEREVNRSSESKKITQVIESGIRGSALAFPLIAIIPTIEKIFELQLGARDPAVQLVRNLIRKAVSVIPPKEVSGRSLKRKGSRPVRSHSLANYVANREAKEAEEAKEAKEADVKDEEAKVSEK